MKTKKTFMEFSPHWQLLPPNRTTTKIFILIDAHLWIGRAQTKHLCLFLKSPQIEAKLRLKEPFTLNNQGLVLFQTKKL